MKKWNTFFFFFFKRLQCFYKQGGGENEAVFLCEIMTSAASWF